MPTQNLLPTAVTLGTGWYGAVTDIDEGVDTPNDNTDYISSPAGLDSYGNLVIDFANPTITPPFIKVTIKIRFSSLLGNTTKFNALTLTTSLGNLTDGDSTICIGTYPTWQAPSAFTTKSASISGSFTQSQGDDLQVTISRNDCSAMGSPPSDEIRITAIDAIVENAAAGGNESFSWSEEVKFSDAWAVTRSAGDITTGDSPEYQCRFNPEPLRKHLEPPYRNWFETGNKLLVFRDDLIRVLHGLRAKQISGSQSVTSLAIDASVNIYVGHESTYKFCIAEYPVFTAVNGIDIQVFATLTINGQTRITDGKGFCIRVTNVGIGGTPSFTLNWKRRGHR